MGFRGVLWNDVERRPRALLRVLLLIVVSALLAVGTSVGATIGFDFLQSWLSTTFSEAIATTIGAVLGVGLTGGTVTLAVLIAGRYIDRRRLRDFGFRFDRDWWLDYGFGLALGVGLMTLLFLVELALGWVRVTGTFQPRTGFPIRFAGLVAIFVVVGIYEELLLRGYLLTNAAEGLVGSLGERGAVGVATLLSSLVFGLAHANNPNATLLSTLAIVVAGVMLAAGYVLTGDLAVPIGLHTTWNLFQGGVYGFPVSGLGVGASVIAVEETGPDVVTGGAFGPEAGLVGLGAMVVGTTLVAAWVRWRTGDLRIDPAVTTPELRGETGDESSSIDADRWEPGPSESE